MCVNETHSHFEIQIENEGKKMPNYFLDNLQGFNNLFK